MNAENRKTTTPELRKKIILELLKNQDSISTQEIVNACNASEITIRRDLSKFEEKGLLIRTHGGAINKTATETPFTFNHKVSRNEKTKSNICKIASKFIRAYDIIFVDSGSTLSFLSRYISKTEPLTVITNALPLASALINFENIKLILIGGEVVNERKAVYGHTAEQNIRQYHANKAFIGTDGISLSKGLTSYDLKEASITTNMAENADEVFLLCDSTKVEKNSFVRFAPLSTINYLITDRALTSGLMSKYEKHHIKIVSK